MDGLANHEDDLTVGLNEFLFMTDPLDHLEIPYNLASNCDAMGEAATLQHPNYHPGEPALAPLTLADNSIMLGPFELSQPVMDNDESTYPSLAVMGDQGGTMSSYTQPSSLSGYAESFNTCMSPSSLQFDWSLSSSSSEHSTTTTEQQRTIGGHLRRVREIRPRPPGLVGTNANNGQPSTRECKPKARANKHTGGRTCTVPGDKRQPRGRRKKSYACERCGEDLKDSKKLTRHYRVDHKEWARVTKGLTVEFPCPVSGCTKKSTRKDNLKRHQRNQHPWLNEQYTSVS